MSRRFAAALGPSRRAPAVTAAVGGVLLAVWLLWFFLAQLSVYEVSRTARLEVDLAPHPIDAPVGGRVRSGALTLGTEVRQGEVLVVLESDELALELDRERARLANLDPQIAALQRELAEDTRAAASEGLVASAAQHEAEARRRASESLAALKLTERGQVERLRERQVVAEMESVRMRSEAEQRAAEAEAALRGVKRIGGEFQVRQSDRRARLARLELELAQLEGLRQETAARTRRLERDIELRTIRAPVAGRLGDVVPLRPGAVVSEGARLAVVVPGSGLRAVAQFEAAAIGRVQPGQSGRLRLVGFPWTKHGALQARVSRVGNEPTGGLVRVELEVRREPGATAPLEHGLPGVVEVAVERLSPAALVLDAAGRFVTRVDAEAGKP